MRLETRPVPGAPFRGQVLLTWQGVWAGETAVLVTPGLSHCEEKHLAQVHSRCSVSGEKLPRVGF